MERSHYVWLGILALALIGYSIYTAKVTDPAQEEASRQYEECIKAEYGQSVEQYRLENNKMPSCTKNLQ